MALQDQDTLPETDVADAETYVPPRSSAFRTSKYPGFWSPGATIGNDPNPLSGAAPEAALSPGETGIPLTPPADTSSDATPSFRTVQPNATDPGESADARASQAEDDARLTGSDDNPNDALKAANLASAVLGGGTGLLGLGIGEATTALGVNPSDAVYGGGSSFDFTGNLNQRPGWSDAYSASLDEAHKLGLRGPQAAQKALDGARDTLTSGAGGWGRPGATQPRDAVPTATPQDVTAANSVTGFARPAAAPVAPAARDGGAPAAPSNPGVGAPTPSTAGFAGPVAPAAPATTGFGGAGKGGSENGGGAAGGRAPGERGGGTGDNHMGMGDRGYARGGVIQHFDIGGEVQDAPPIDMTQPTPAVPPAQPVMPPQAPQASASQDPRYAPPPEATDPQGRVDGVQAAVTPGEFVIQREAAQVYTPEVLQLINENPDMVEAILEAIVGGLDGGQSEDSGDDTDAEALAQSGISDDNSGLGVAEPTGRFPIAKKDPRNQA
jgi:hypothetical protein